MLVSRPSHHQAMVLWYTSMLIMINIDLDVINAPLATTASLVVKIQPRKHLARNQNQNVQAMTWLGSMLSASVINLHHAWMLWLNGGQTSHLHLICKPTPVNCYIHSLMKTSTDHPPQSCTVPRSVPPNLPHSLSSRGRLHHLTYICWTFQAELLSWTIAMLGCCAVVCQACFLHLYFRPRCLCDLLAATPCDVLLVGCLSSFSTHGHDMLTLFQGCLKQLRNGIWRDLRLCL